MCLSKITRRVAIYTFVINHCSQKENCLQCFLFEISKKHFQRHFSPPSPLSRNQISSRSRGRKLCLIIITVNSLNWNQSNNCIMIMISVCVCLPVCLSVYLCVCLSIVHERFNSPSISLFTFFLLSSWSFCKNFLWEHFLGRKILRLSVKPSKERGITVRRYFVSKRRLCLSLNGWILSKHRKSFKCIPWNTLMLLIHHYNHRHK